MAVITKKEIYSRVGKLGLLPKERIRWVLDAILKEITDELVRGNVVMLKPFGRFSVVESKARKGMNVYTRKPLIISAKKRIKFKAGKDMKVRLNNG
jgi:nucleoid DNA-binding protein